MKDMHIQGPQIHQFNNIAEQPIPRSSFKRDFSLRTTFNPDKLIPIFLDEILPGDEVHLKMYAQVRLSTPLKPIMDNLYLDTHWFFVPNRLVWTNWEKFQGQQTNPGDSVAYTIPVLDNTKAPMSTTGFTEQSIYDYMGLPIKVTGLSGISALFNRAIDTIWNAWYRDENLNNSITVATGDSADDPAVYDLRVRNKTKDYFTSMTTAPQKGTAVSIGLTGTAPVLGIGKGNTTYGVTSKTVYESDATTSVYANTETFGPSDPNQQFYVEMQTVGGTNYPNIRVSGASFSAITINALRQAALYQQILELDMRGGTRYVESIYTRFGVISPDFRLQRPELIGQGSSRINVYAVPQTAPQPASGTTTPQGNLAAFGQLAITGNHGCRYYATEHGMIIGLASVRADLTYSQGVPRMFLRSTRLDFYEPLLNGLGEQTVTNAEWYAQGTSADQDPAGYQERFAEYRFKNSQITGLFRPAATGTLAVWNVSQNFSGLPGLNSTFIANNMPIDRILAVATSVAPAFMADINYDFTHVRPMPLRSNPGIDRL